MENSNLDKVTVKGGKRKKVDGSVLSILMKSTKKWSENIGVSS